MFLHLKSKALDTWVSWDAAIGSITGPGTELLMQQIGRVKSAGGTVVLAAGGPPVVCKNPLTSQKDMALILKSMDCELPPQLEPFLA